jgi:predicted nucleotidyltransferase component of viral defense system
MSERELMKFKAALRAIAESEGIPAQVVLQNFMFERLLARLVKSPIRQNLILKGGLLIASLLGPSRRTTMDLDITIRDQPLTEEWVRSAMTDIFSLAVDDGISFEIKSIAPIRDDDVYGGFRVKLTATRESIVVPLSIDISTGDVITPAPHEYHLKSLFVTNAVFKIYGYTVETILAEKLETILYRGILTTRPRDFYDIALLSEFCKPNIAIVKTALRATCRHRGTEGVLADAHERIIAVQNDKGQQEQWAKYQQSHPYAKGKQFAEICELLHEFV